MASLLNRPITSLVALLALLAGISVSNIAVAQDGFAAVAGRSGHWEGY
jgi:hypothetical protein